jgi:hypothetical protein
MTPKCLPSAEAAGSASPAHSLSTSSPRGFTPAGAAAMGGTHKTATPQSAPHALVQIGRYINSASGLPAIAAGIHGGHECPGPIAALAALGGCRDSLIIAVSPY